MLIFFASRSGSCVSGGGEQKGAVEESLSPSNVFARQILFLSNGNLGDKICSVFTGTNFQMTKQRPSEEKVTENEENKQAID